jgi:RNA polymerase sigma factor (sigma-70 family)
MTEASDDDLMRAYAAGDVAAFERLYARHQAGLYRFVRRLLAPALAAQVDEVFQDTWLRVVHARARWQPQGAAFGTWLYTLAHHRAIDLWRRSGRDLGQRQAVVVMQQEDAALRYAMVKLRTCMGAYLAPLQTAAGGAR